MSSLQPVDIMLCENGQDSLGIARFAKMPAPCPACQSHKGCKTPRIYLDCSYAILGLRIFRKNLHRSFAHRIKGADTWTPPFDA